tara:strand:- start:574 stop:1323 length:750 start_codon:yes stop_codon:yes gene_type:complete
MKKLSILILFAISSLTSYADDHQSYTTYTGEVLQCNLQDGKEVDDVLKMVKKDWYALDYPVPYEGWVLTPTLYADNDGGYDLFWAGFAFNNTDMGSTLDWFFENGTKVFSKWENLVSCASWSHWDIFEARRPASELVEGDSNVWAFHSCNFKDGKGVSDLRANDMIWNKYLDGIEHTGGVWRWWAGGGSNTQDTPDYYVNISFSNMNEFGQYRDARLKAMMDGKLPEQIADCAPPRVYAANNIKAISTN